MKNLRKKFRGFTLVELIVVITILVILGTIGFTSLGNFAGSARDSVRVSDMKNMETGLSLFNIKSGVYPDPETPTSIEASGTVLALQGYFGDLATSITKLNTTPVDPVDKTKYVYTVNALKTKYQMMAYMEDTSNFTLGAPLIETVYALDYNKRYPKVSGNSVGILLDSGTLSPINGTKIDLITTNSGATYKAYFSNVSTDVVTTSGTGLFSNIYNRREDLVKDKALASLDSSLVGYWDMETMTGGLLKDLSGYGNHGTLSGSILIGKENGISGKSTYFDGNIGKIIVVPNSASLNIGGPITIMFSIRTSFTTAGWSGPIAKDINCGLNTRQYIVGIYRGVPSGSFTYCSLSPNGASDSDLIYSVADNTWHTVAFTVDGANWRYYDNGVLKKVTPSLLLPTMTSANLYIGNNYSYGLNGSLDEARIYNRALSDSEIAALYSAAK